MDKMIMTMGFLAGRSIAWMRRVTKEPVAYLYNGVRLPKLPDKYGSIYSHALIVKGITSATSGIYHLFLSESEFTMASIYNYNIKAPSTTYILRDSNWELVEESIEDKNTSLRNGVWASHDIPYSDGSGISVTTSDPIPVYE